MGSNLKLQFDQALKQYTHAYMLNTSAHVCRLANGPNLQKLCQTVKNAMRFADNENEQSVKSWVWTLTMQTTYQLAQVSLTMTVLKHLSAWLLLSGLSWLLMLSCSNAGPCGCASRQSSSGPEAGKSDHGRRAHTALLCQAAGLGEQPPSFRKEVFTVTCSHISKAIMLV